MSKEGAVSTRPPWRQRDSQADLSQRILRDNSASTQALCLTRPRKAFSGACCRPFPRAWDRAWLDIRITRIARPGVHLQRGRFIWSQWTECRHSHFSEGPVIILRGSQWNH